MKQYATIVADPPWNFGDKLPGAQRGAARHYDLLRGAAAIVGAYPVDALALPNSRLFLWRVAAMQEEALTVMHAWGFIPKSEIVWIKRRRPLAGQEKGKLWFGMGRQVRMSHEVCLIGIRGRPERLSASFRSIFTAEVPYDEEGPIHSAKPEVFFRIVEELSPGPYLELFARNKRKAWTCRGKELNA